MTYNAFAYGPNQGNWQIVNDTVMGGRSSSRAQALENGVVKFVGSLSLANNGGFASIRSSSPDYSISNAKEIILEVMGDGRTYSLNLRTENNWRAFSYRQFFQTQAQQLITIRLPLSDFQPTSFGRVVPNAKALNPKNIQSIGFMVSDKREGAFELDVISIKLGGQTESSPLSINNPVDFIDMAISKGVPLFNRGDHDACADIYEMTLLAMSMMNDDMISQGLKQQWKILMPQSTAMDPSDKAWALRRILDDSRAKLLSR